MSAATPFLPGLAEPAAPSRDEVQRAMVEGLLDYRLNGRPSGLLQAPTGHGKTFVSTLYVKEGLARWDGRFLFVVHRKELLDQACAAFGAAGVLFEVEWREHRASRSGHSMLGRVPVVVASKDSLVSGERLQRFAPDAFTDVFFDEAHLSRAKTWGEVLARFSGRKFLVGPTATPFRLDGKPLYGTDGSPFAGGGWRPPRFFERPAPGKKEIPDAFAAKLALPTAIEWGHLASFLNVTIPAGIDLKGVRVRGGDFNRQDLEDRISRKVGPLANALLEDLGKYRIDRAILFAPDVGSAIGFASALNGLGVAARAVHGHSKRWPMTDAERDRAISAYKNGRVRVLCSCDLITTGFDDEPTQAIVMARPTKSLALALQMAGRGSRLCAATGKDNCIVLGFQWQGVKGVVSTLDFFLEDEPNPRLRELAAKLASVARGPRDPRLLVEEAREILESEDRRARMKLRVKREATAYRRIEWTPFGAATKKLLGIGEAPAPAPAAPPASDGQRRLLDGFGLKGTRKLDAGTADVLAGRVLDRAFLGLADARQVEALVKRGVPEAEAMAMKAADANRVINAGYSPTPRMRAFLRSRGYRDEVISRMGPQDIRQAYCRLTGKNLR